MTNGRIHIGAVIGEDGLRFAAVERSASQVRTAVAEYVAARAALTLWPNDAAVVSRCLTKGELDLAIDRYFAAVGERWDREWLITADVSMATQDRGRIGTRRHAPDAGV
jgi:hypothetical protein